MRAIVARIPAQALATAWGIAMGVLAWFAGVLGLPDLGRLREILERIQEIVAFGGMALATGISLIFVLAWVLSHLRKPKKKEHPVLPWVALATSYVPVTLTAIAAIGIFVPFLAPYMLKAFAIAVLIAAVSWSVAVAAVLVGGKKNDLARARRALLLAGTPWYCLAVWLSSFL